MTAYLHFGRGSEDEPAYYNYRSAYKDVESALAEAGHLLASFPNRDPKPVDVRDGNGKVLADKRRIAAAKKAAEKAK